ncbi:hypothetical protein [Candidatus Arthromitus sp. SFB-turkey]|uniref:hypothetical protein n=1 Tax=Candidatus Arthromitus sp. SFB-turkey TaxID=1840217 RepID=UPI0009EEE357|nr:hypothetical protein [Candidatus Arthromitus sp. SFB-turkey]HJD00648.1 hypothetical protein [Candidatus Dwaynia gallinarum]
MCCSSNSGYFLNPVNCGCCNPCNYNCYYTPHCGCNNNGLFGLGGGCGSSLGLIALFALLCR